MVYHVEFRPSGCVVDVLGGERLDVVACGAGVSLRRDCGGNGTCGKCKVLIDGRILLACRVNVLRDLVVTVPDVSSEREVIAVQTHDFIGDVPVAYGREADVYGVAVDIGTTTIVAELHKINAKADDGGQLNGVNFPLVVSCANPQRIYGDDVISRIQRIIEEASFLAIFQVMVIRAINELIGRLVAAAGINVTEITRVAVAGNTVMEHIFLGFDPSALGYFPFKSNFSEFPDCLGGDIGLNILSSGVVESLPIFGSFVGGDLVAGVLSVGMYSGGGTEFLIDIGTNGELVLYHGGEFYTSATAAGPAFEGGRIEYGTLAVAGAIDHVMINESGVNVTTIADAPPIGICGSGLMDVVAEMLNNDLILPSGKFNVTIKSPLLNCWKIIDGRPVFVLVAEEKSGRKNEAIVITQKDIRQVQLAVGAIRAGIKLLLRHINLNLDNIETFYVAGGFGSFIKLESAQRIGLIPAQLDKERIKICGNTSLAGARLTLFDSRIKSITKKIQQHAHSIDLATIPDFADIFAEQMIF
ncbi:MAG: ASKHA domain-containing protein [Planctomycetaceae bacterium]|nr:ASKHA domain-containing protein [Planctomycetaceae bacterium]